MKTTKQFKILVVDDSSTNNTLCKIILEKRGYEAIVLEDGRKAIETIRKERPDLVLLDLMMPEEDGFSILKKINEDKTIAKTPVIIVSSIDAPESVRKKMEYEPFDFIPKPIGINHLLEKVEDGLQKINKANNGLFVGG